MTMSSSEIYMAIERGMIEAWLTSYASQLGLSFWEISKYINELLPYFSVQFLAANADTFKSLPENLQQLLIEESQALEPEIFEWSKTSISEQRSELVEKGMIYNELTKEQRADWQELARPLWKEWEETVGEDGKLLRQAVEKYR